MNTLKIEQRDPAELRPLPVVKAMHRWAPDSDEFKAFKLDIKENGIEHPVQILVDGHVVDGWTRVLAAKAWQMPQIPCVVVADDDAKEIILRELLLKRNLTKGQLAFTIVAGDLLASYRREKQHRKLENLRKGQQIPEERLKTPSEDWSSLIGISEETLKRATWLHEVFEKHPEIEEEWHPKLFADDKPMGLEGAKTGIIQQLEAAKNPGKYDPRQKGQLQLFQNTFSRDFCNRFQFWTAHKKAAAAIIEHTAATLSKKDCAAAAAALRDMAAIYEQEAKSTGKE